MAFMRPISVAVACAESHDAGSAGIMVSVTIGSTIILSPLLLVPDFTVPQEAMVWLRVMALVIFGQVLGQGLVTVALRHLPVASKFRCPHDPAGLSSPPYPGRSWASSWRLAAYRHAAGVIAMWIVVDPPLCCAAAAAGRVTIRRARLAHRRGCQEGNVRTLRGPVCPGSASYR